MARPGSRGAHDGKRDAPRRGRGLGPAGEAVAEAYLRRRGYVILARNYRCPAGEVDLVARDGPTVVFVEVKTRSGSAYGSPLEAVDARKRHRLARVACHFLLHARATVAAARPAKAAEPAETVRFDVIGVHWSDETPAIDHVENAFEAS